VIAGLTIGQHFADTIDPARDGRVAVQRLGDSFVQRQSINLDKRIDAPSDSLDREARVLEYNCPRNLAGHTFKQIASEPFVCSHTSDFTPIERSFKLSPKIPRRLGDPVVPLPASLDEHRVAAKDLDAICEGRVRYSPVKSIWFLGIWNICASQVHWNAFRKADIRGCPHWSSPDDGRRPRLRPLTGQIQPGQFINGAP
jgi:hypothetical protein